VQQIPAFVGPAARLLPRRLGRYQLFAHIGRGGMADIHLAHADTGFGDAKRLVVIKEMRDAYAESVAFSDALVGEAKLAAQLSHANVVKVEDLGRVDGSLFIAMEYVEGLDLRELLRCCAKDRIALPVEFSLRIVIETLRGLSFAHRARDEGGHALGIVHRDVSPSNILLSFEGEVKVCDFGIARANALAEAAAEESGVVGKAGYMSPEQARGEVIDGRADVFAAGIILWELLSGRRLYRPGEGRPLLATAQAAVIPDLPDHGLPEQEALYAIVHRALTADRDERYSSAALMREDLEEYAMSTDQLGSELRFGEWLMENFGRDVVRERRSRERAMRALALGPAAVIQALPDQPSAGTLRLMLVDDLDDADDFELTPSQFLVAPNRAALEALLAEEPVSLGNPPGVPQTPPDRVAPDGVAPDGAIDRALAKPPRRWRARALGVFGLASCLVAVAALLLRRLH